MTELSPKIAPTRPWYLPRSLAFKHVSDDRERDREQCPRPETLDPPEGDELPHLLREAGKQRPDQEDRDREEQDRPATEEVRQLPVDRSADRGREDVRSKGPGVDVVAMKVGDDPRERGPTTVWSRAARNKPRRTAATIWVRVRGSTPRE